jgi:hypothetical protein
MENRRFDAWVRALARPLSRRTAFMGFAFGMATRLSVGDDVAARRRRRRRRRCSPACGPCQRCNTRSGRCVNLADGATCGECLVCASGQCTQVAPDETPCRGDGRCGSGRCFGRPSCTNAFGSCSISDMGPDPSCCSGHCLLTGSFPYLQLGCSLSVAGDPCHSIEDCAPGLTCRVFTCG